MNDIPIMPPTNHVLLEYRLTQQEKELSVLKEHITKLENHIADADAKRSAQEKRQLLAGIMFLGSVIMSLGGVLWTYRSIIFRG